jgi:peroxiredoxin
MKYSFLLCIFFVYTVYGQEVSDRALVNEQLQSIDLQIKDNPEKLELYKQYFNLYLNNHKTVDQLEAFYPEFERIFTQMESSLPNKDSLYSNQIKICMKYINCLGTVFRQEAFKLYKDKRQTDLGKLYKIHFDRIKILEEKYYKICLNLNDNVNDSEILSICESIRKVKRMQNFIDSLKINTAPDFSALDIRKKMISLNSFKGKFVLLHFWSMYSNPAVAELKDLIKLNKQYSREDLVIIGINVDKLNTVLEKNVFYNFIKEMDLSWYHIMDGNDRKLVNLYYIRDYPMLFLINREGYIIFNNEELRGENLFSNLAKINLTTK